MNKLTQQTNFKVIIVPLIQVKFLCVSCISHAMSLNLQCVPFTRFQKMN